MAKTSHYNTTVTTSYSVDTALDIKKHQHDKTWGRSWGKNHFSQTLNATSRATSKENRRENSPSTVRGLAPARAVPQNWTSVYRSCTGNTPLSCHFVLLLLQKPGFTIDRCSLMICAVFSLPTNPRPSNTPWVARKTVLSRKIHSKLFNMHTLLLGEKQV